MAINNYKTTYQKTSENTLPCAGPAVLPARTFPSCFTWNSFQSQTNFQHIGSPKWFSTKVSLGISFMAHFTLESPVFQNTARLPPQSTSSWLRVWVAKQRRHRGHQQGIWWDIATKDRECRQNQKWNSDGEPLSISMERTTKHKHIISIYIYIHSIFGHTKHDTQSLLKSFNQPTPFTTPPSEEWWDWSLTGWRGSHFRGYFRICNKPTRFIIPFDNLSELCLATSHSFQIGSSKLFTTKKNNHNQVLGTVPH